MWSCSCIDFMVSVLTFRVVSPLFLPILEYYSSMMPDLRNSWHVSSIQFFQESFDDSFSLWQKIWVVLTYAELKVLALLLEWTMWQESGLALRLQQTKSTHKRTLLSKPIRYHPRAVLLHIKPKERKKGGVRFVLTTNCTYCWGAAKQHERDKLL